MYIYACTHPFARWGRYTPLYAQQHYGWGPPTISLQCVVAPQRLTKSADGHERSGIARPAAAGLLIARAGLFLARAGLFMARAGLFLARAGLFIGMTGLFIARAALFIAMAALFIFIAITRRSMDLPVRLFPSQRRLASACVPISGFIRDLFIGTCSSAPSRCRTCCSSASSRRACSTARSSCSTTASSRPREHSRLEYPWSTPSVPLEYPSSPPEARHLAHPCGAALPMPLQRTPAVPPQYPRSTP